MQLPNKYPDIHVHVFHLIKMIGSVIFVHSLSMQCLPGQTPRDGSLLFQNKCFYLVFGKLTLKVLNFCKFTSYCSLKPLWLGMGEVVPGRTSPTLHPPSPPTVHQLSRLAL